MPAHILPRYFKGRVEKWMERKIDQIFSMIDILQKRFIASLPNFCNNV